LNKKLIILHSNGKLYFSAVEYLCKENGIKYQHIQTTWFKNFIKLILKKQCSNCSFKNSLKSFLFFLSVPFIKNKTVIYGTAPYDIRFLWYSLLSKKNNFIYHTSHYKWENDSESVFNYCCILPVLKNFWKRKLEKIKIVGVTKAVEKSLKNILQNKNIYQIYHSINFKIFYNPRDFKKEKKIKILFVGRMVYEKGLDTVVDLINRSDPQKYEFTFVGDGKYRKKIEYIFERENVKYLGWITDKNKMSQIYKEHHILLNPSIKIRGWEELFGIVNIEAMAAGMIVIASEHIGPKEIIENNKNGFLIKEKDVDKIIEIINHLYENRDKMNHISENASEFAKRFDIKEISEQWKKVINA